MIQRSSEGPVAVLTIDRPNRRNALSEDTVLSLKRHLRQIESDPAIRVTIITGSAPGFCAGSDLKELANMDLEGMCAHEADTGLFCRSISQLRKPVIAAVEGFALGGGFVFAASCDVIVSSASCRWHLPEVQIGWIPPWGLETLVARLGPVAARRLAWGGEVCDGAEAYRIGLADYLAEDGRALEKALEVAQRLASLPDVAVASVKAYFAPHAGKDGETGDVIANRMFEENCKYPVAIATLKKFGVRA
ncbi:enoyl-CoA hydratase/isomerase family protein [Pollutimonas sp. M17]|uniref:enoyl-CoA hydratase/isomerase family protein n=1 Tax=Pollutimonas sp. M17 TaxID=2962065 RepID=UPI0021F4A846|nr:enoyl-CoA hydratase/isomerase family protein [Pollutimonas sp. M17]UYO93448.1 enoyl-CoA hydratase/isomerase family protein [Pollutimonas sp. M17]